MVVPTNPNNQNLDGVESWSTFQGQTTDEQAVVTDVADAEAAQRYAGDPLRGLMGFSFGALNTSQHQLALATQEAETFANNVGWRYFPSISMIMSVANSGYAGDSTWALQAYYNALPANVQATVPWARYGFDREKYIQKNQSMDALAEELTGPNTPTFDRAFNSQNLRDMALTNNWTNQQLQDFVMADPTYQQQYGWFRHQMTYNQFTHYLDTNSSAIEDRFGKGNVNIKNGLETLDKPLVATGGAGTTIGNTDPESQGKSPTQTYSQSSIR